LLGNITSIGFDKVTFKLDSQFRKNVAK